MKLIYDPASVNPVIEDHGDHYSMDHQEAETVIKIKMVSIDQFKKMDFDYIVPTIYNHEESFLKLRDKFQPKAKMIRHIGNVNDVSTGKIPNFLNSTAQWPTLLDYKTHVKRHTVLWREEIDTRQFCWSEPTVHDTIRMIAPYPREMVDYPLWKAYRSAMPDFKWNEHGFVSDHGYLSGPELPKAFKDSAFIWHVKFRGDGFGHTIHHAYACGRPCIVRGSYYKNCIAAPLLEHGVSCIDLDKMDYMETLSTIRFWAQPDNHLVMCKEAYRKFKENVDFDKEFEDVKVFLAECI